MASPFDDPALAHFLGPTFDPVQYLNSTLPIVSGTSPITFQTGNSHGPGSTLPDVAVKVQTVLSQLSGQAAQLCETLTADTDKLLRLGPRLAFEVDSLAEEVSRLRAVFVRPGGKTSGEKLAIDHFLDSLQPISLAEVAAPTAGDGPSDEPRTGVERSTPAQTNFISTLSSLALARSRLDGVIRLFGEATKWPTPPTAPISSRVVSADPFATALIDDEDDILDTDPFLQQLCIEIASVIDEPESVVAHPADQSSTLAGKMLDALQVLSRIWDGTSEERIRKKVVADLRKLAFDDSRRRGRDRLRTKTSSLPDPGFLDNLAEIVAGVEESD